MIKHLTSAVDRKKIPQSEALPGQVANSAGGFSFEVDDWVKLDRFLILGTEGGSYYASERALTKKSLNALNRCIAADGVRVVSRIIQISHDGRAPKNDQAIFALAACLSLGDVATRQAVKAALPMVCRIGTHLFQFMESCKALEVAWGPSKVKAVKSWYNGQSLETLAHNMVKYQNREGWRHRDVLRLAHVKPTSPSHQALYRWALGLAQVGEQTGPLPDIVQAFEQAKATKDVQEWVQLIERHNLPRECLPTEALNHIEVWDALLRSGKGMPITAMIRNLGKMTSIGLLKPLSAATKFVTERLQEAELLKRGRVHPLAILLALSTYRTGHGMKGGLSWVPVTKVCDALDEAFYLAFGAVEPTGKRRLIALDISGSMGGSTIANTFITAREASALMAMLTLRTEAQTHVVGFTAGVPGEWGSGRPSAHNSSGVWGYSGTGAHAGISEIRLTPKMTLPKVIETVSSLPMGGTDCAAPMLYAIDRGLEVDSFEVYTDSETWAGKVHPSQALKRYRKKSGIDAKLTVVGMCANEFSIADPKDAGMLDVCGFDTHAPEIIAEFIRG